MKIFIIGATGFIGEALTRALIAKSLQNTAEKIEITAHGTNAKLCQEFRTLGCNVLEKHDLTQIKQTCSDQDVIVNCAGLAKTFDLPERFDKINVDLVRVLRDECLINKAKLIHLSSPSVYVDYQNHENIKEEKEGESLPPPVCDYARTKQEADKLIKEGWKKGLRAMIYRPHLVYGPGDKKILSGLIQAHKDGFLPLFNDGEIKVDMTYIDNCVHALMLGIFSNDVHTLSQIYNITDCHPQKVKDLVTELFKDADIQLKNAWRLPAGSFTVMRIVLTVVEYGARLLQFFGYNPPLEKTSFWLQHFACTATHDNSNAKERLGYAPLVSAEEGKIRFANWYKKQDHFKSSTLGIANVLQIKAKNSTIQDSDILQNECSVVPNYRVIKSRQNAFFINEKPQRDEKNFAPAIIQNPLNR